MRLKESLKQIVAGANLSAQAMSSAMVEIMDGKASPAQAAAFLVALRMKGETAEEIAVAARVLRERARTIRPPEGGVIVDTCGTGGDQLGTFNISTTAAFVIAGAGVRVAKHGNRKATGACGSADLLEALGVSVDASPEECEGALQEIGICFLFARSYHPAMRAVAEVRSDLEIRTLFNIIGPLLNPAGTRHHLLGVFDRGLTEVLARVLQSLGAERAWVVHGEDGLDEITTTDLTRVTALERGKIETFWVKPEDFGLHRVSVSDLRGGESIYNASITRDVLEGVRGPARDIVLLNAAAGLVVAGAAETLLEGLDLAKRSIDGGAAQRKLELLRSRKPAGGD